MANSQDWLNQLNNLGDKPTYTSKYQGTIDNLLDKIVNRESFSYDFNADPLYQQYKEQYTKLGNEASMNAAANVSSLTGGYGNSYAATAASQANQQYLTQLNNIIPQLEAAAMDKYQMESENLMNQYSAVGNAEDRDYGHYRDSVADYYADRDYYYNGYNNASNFEYQQNRDAIADAQWRESFDYQKNIDDRNFNYQKERDAVSDAQWEKQYALSQAKARTSGSGSSSGAGAASNRYFSNSQAAGFGSDSMSKNENSKTVERVKATPDDMNYYTAIVQNMTPEEAEEFIANLYGNNKEGKGYISDYQMYQLKNAVR